MSSIGLGAMTLLVRTAAGSSSSAAWQAVRRGHFSPGLFGDGALCTILGSKNGNRPEAKVRVGVDYTFADAFGTAEVGYCFERHQLFCTDRRPRRRCGAACRRDAVSPRRWDVATVTPGRETKTWEPLRLQG